MKDRQRLFAPAAPDDPGPVASSTGWGWFVALGLTAVLLGMAALPPFTGPTVRAALMQAFSSFCHQIPDRSPHLDGVALAVCHRCFGIYAGLLAGVLAHRVLRRWEGALSRQARYVLPAALVPAGADWLLGLLGLWVNTPWSRTLTGVVFGLVAGFYLASGLSRAFTTT